MFAPPLSGASMPTGLFEALASLVEHIVEEKLTARLAAISLQATADQPSHEWLSVKEAAVLFGVCRQTIHRWAKKGLISRFKLDERGITFFDRNELNQALQKQTRSDGTRKHARRQFQPQQVAVSI
ncbi:helix-turn-helix domain-containing protein [Hymenobacter busanensis]|nr:helix-turn-helix domain-containing protein [Hymenobacter busanensis]QHJ07580.1 helix-turn-helix domain-containing protein [Hymenobacter busanensis]